MGDEEENDDIVGKEYPGGRVGLNCRIIKEEDKVIVEEINHGFVNDGYDDYLYEDNGNISVFIAPYLSLYFHLHLLTGLSKKEQEESGGVTCCIMDAVWYVIFRFCRYNI